MASCEEICAQEEIPIVVTKCMVLETKIKGHHVYKDIWTPIVGEKLEVRAEPENPVKKICCVRQKT